MRNSQGGLLRIVYIKYLKIRLFKDSRRIYFAWQKRSFFVVEQSPLNAGV
jgi:hypothetical protein